MDGDKKAGEGTGEDGRGGDGTSVCEKAQKKKEERWSVCMTERGGDGLRGGRQGKTRNGEGSASKRKKQGRKRVR